MCNKLHNRKISANEIQWSLRKMSLFSQLDGHGSLQAGPIILCLKAWDGLLQADKLVEGLECLVSQGQGWSALVSAASKHLEQYLAYRRHSVNISWMNFRQNTMCKGRAPGSHWVPLPGIYGLSFRCKRHIPAASYGGFCRNLDMILKFSDAQ